jgi:hypothetical protein
MRADDKSCVIFFVVSLLDVIAVDGMFLLDM